jgi:hypothetical protein
MRTVSLEDAPREIAEKGFRPRAVVVDPAVLLEPNGGELARYLAGSAALTAIPVLSISSAARRVELEDLLGALHRLQRTTNLRPAH